MKIVTANLSKTVAKDFIITLQIIVLILHYIHIWTFQSARKTLSKAQEKVMQFFHYDYDFALKGRLKGFLSAS